MKSISGFHAKPTSRACVFFSGHKALSSPFSCCTSARRAFTSWPAGAPYLRWLHHPPDIALFAVPRLQVWSNIPEEKSSKWRCWKMSVTTLSIRSIRSMVTAPSEARHGAGSSAPSVPTEPSLRFRCVARSSRVEVAVGQKGQKTRPIP